MRFQRSYRVLCGVTLIMTVLLGGCVRAPQEGSPSASPERQSAATPGDPGSSQAQALPPTEAPRYSGPAVFTDVTAHAGIKFVHNSGAFGKKYLPETVGSGCAFLDYDGDGWQDILLINSMSWPGHKGRNSLPALYHNNQNGTFTDVTAEAGLAVEMYGLGCAAADYDNDGDIDIYITCLGSNRLFRNTGGKFADVAAKAGVEDPGFSTSAAWVDYDKDGKLDLFVCHYIEWSLEKDIYCTLDQKNKSYCTPEAYKGQSSTLFRNKGDGVFENVTDRAGLRDATSKALGVALIDFDADGWIDLLVANDTQPNKLYRNKGDGSFTDVAVTAGVAVNDAGMPRAGMGIDVADYDGSGRPSIVIGNFSEEMIALYHNEGGGLFVDEAPTSTIGQASLLTLTFACFFFDYDLDGLLDIFAANGHVSDDIATVKPKIMYAQSPHLFRNLGKKKFDAVGAKLGPALQQPIVARGASYGDFDNDGDLDLMVTANNGPARLLRNDGGNQNNLLRIKLVGTSSNRDGIGARVSVKSASGATIWSLVKTGSSYCSQSELPVTFGLGRAEKAASVEVLWPNGRKDATGEIGANQTITIQEGKGVITTMPIVLTAP